MIAIFIDLQNVFIKIFTVERKKFLLIILLFIMFFQNLYSQNNLQYFIDEAKKNSSVIYKLNNQNKITDLDFEQIKTAYTKPQISANANLLFSPIISTDNNKTQFQPITENAINYYGYDLGYTDGGQYQAMVEINQSLFNAKKIQVFKQKAGILQQETSNNINLTSKELEYSVKHQYLLCLIAQKEIDFAEENINFIDDEIKIMGKLVENAIYQPSDLSLMKIEQKNYIIQSEKYQAIYKQNISNLLILCGITDTTNIKLEDTNFTLNTGNIDNVFIEKFTTDSLKIITNQQIDNIKYKPQLSAFANTGLNAIYLPNYDRLGASFGLKLSWLLYDGKQANIVKQKSEISLDNINFEKQKTISENEIRNQNIIEQIKAIDKQILFRTEQINDYFNLLELYKIKISQGNMSIINYTEILTKISDTKNEKLLLEMQKQILINKYNYWNK